MDPRPAVEWHDVAEADWDQQVNVGLKGVWLSMKYELPAMLARGGGAIVNNSSVAGLIGAGGGPYTAIKHGIIGLTRSASVKYGARGIRINAVCPGVIDTSVWQRRYVGDPEFESDLRQIQSMNRIGSAEEVAQAVLWLCSARSSFVTGQYLVVDGGMMARGVVLPVKKR
jgi:NAD(P)-dependent dehydrogenase (short-subunit alcohol dehydrogenase family)